MFTTGRMSMLLDIDINSTLLPRCIRCSYSKPTSKPLPIDTICTDLQRCSLVACLKISIKTICMLLGAPEKLEELYL